MTIPRPLLLATLIITGCFLPLACVPIAVVLAPVNPMSFCCLDTVTFTNESGEALTIVPVGVWRGSGVKGVLPIMEDGRFGMIKFGYREFGIPQGANIEIEYDADDIVCEEVLIRSETGMHFILDFDPYRPNNSGEVGIPSLTELSPASIDYVNSITQSGTSAVRQWVLFALGILAPILFWVQFRAYKRHPAFQLLTDE